MLRQLWNDEAGFIISSELILVATILVIGMIVGLSQVQTAVVQELADVASAIGHLNQSYGFRGFSGCKAVTLGSTFADAADVCDSTSCAITITCATDPSLNESVALGAVPGA